MRKVFYRHFNPEALRNEIETLRQLLGGLEHDNIVMYMPLEGTGFLGNGQYFRNMQLCDMNLQDYYFQRGRSPCSSWWLSWPIEGRRTFFVVGLMQQLLNGLYFFFSHGRAHGGLKPENSKFKLSMQSLTLLVLYSVEDGMWKIADARFIYDGATGLSSSEDGRYCADSYTAPESLHNDVGLAADVRALGCILLALCSGGRRFPSEQTSLPIDSIRSSFLSEFNEEQVRVFLNWITEMLERDQKKKPNPGMLCFRFSELLGLLGPVSHTYHVEPHDHIFFSKRELLGTEVQIWPNAAQYEQTFPRGCTAEQQDVLIARRRDRLRARTMLLGGTSPHAVWFKMYLGWTYFYGTRIKCAHTEFLNARKIMEQNPTAWPNTITTTFGVAWAELQMNKLARARDSFQQVIEQLTPEHGLDPRAAAREYLRCETGIAETFRRQGKSQDAIDLLEEVIECQKDGWNSEDTDTLDSGVMFAKAHYDLGDYQKARTLFSELHETLKRPEVMGEEHPDTLICVCWLAWSEIRLGKHLKALELFIDVLPRQMRVHVPGSSEVSDSYEGLKRVLTKLRRQGNDPNIAELLRAGENLASETKEWMIGPSPKKRKRQ